MRAQATNPTKVFPEPGPTLTCKASFTAHAVHTANLPRRTGFIRFSFQRFQALLTLFSKSFSPFPHGTCLLSVPNQYLALDEIYHPLGAPVPRNVTLRVRTVQERLQMTDGTLTHSDALFQGTYICALPGSTSRDYNSRPKAPISILSFSLFIRHY